MTSVIRLHDPFEKPAHAGQERLVLFPGRHLGEDEFDRRQAYVEARLDRLFTGSRPGVVYGLEVDARTDAAGLLRESFAVKPGLAVDAAGQVLTLLSPLRPLWADLVAGAADGLYLLVITREVMGGQPMDPSEICRRDEGDPTRDLRLEQVVRTALLAVPDLGLPLAQRARIGNRFAVANVDVDLLPAGLRAAPLALVAVQGGAALWCDRAAGRRLSLPAAGHYALLDQCTLALRDVLAERRRQDGESSADWAARLVAGLRERVEALPAAIQLPPAILAPVLAGVLSGYEQLVLGGQEPPPGYSVLADPGLGADVVPIRASQVQETLRRELPRGPLRLGAAGGDRVRLCLAISDRDWRPDLLDLPQADTDVLEGLQRQYLAALAAWAGWRAAQDVLTGDAAADHAADFAVKTQSAGGSGSVNFSTTITVKAAEKAALLGARTDAAPDDPATLQARLVDREVAERGLPKPQLPQPYRGPLPDPYQGLQAWLAARGLALPDAPPAPPVPGAGVRRLELERAIAALEDSVAGDQEDLDELRDHVLNQRQHLDAQTLNLAALAGGVATDGSGLRMLRALPFVKLDPGAGVPKPALAAPHGLIAMSDVAEVASQPSFSFSPPPPSFTLPFMMQAPPAAPAAQAPFSSQLFDKLSAGALSVQVETAKISEPAFTMQASDFGVLSHVRPDVYAVGDAVNGAAFLRTKALGLNALKNITLPVFVDPGANQDNPYQQLVDLGRHTVDLIGTLEQRRLQLERDLRAKADELASWRRERDELLAQEPQLRAALKRAADALKEALDDYAMAERMMQEDWSAVEDLDDRRRDLLANPAALLLVRARQEPIAMELPDPLPLRRAARGDLAPGCGIVEGPIASRFDLDRAMRALPRDRLMDHAEVRRLIDREFLAVQGISKLALERGAAPAASHAPPSGLDAFLDAIWELPARDLLPLRPLLPQLPDRGRIAVLVASRGARLAARVASPPPTTPRLVGLQLAATSMLRAFAAAAPPPAATSERLARQSAGQVLGLADLVSGTAGPLRSAAEQLRGNLERAAGCLSAQLDGTPAGVRLAWGELADDDRLPLESPESWPLLSKLEASAFNTARTLIEIVGWWFRQIDAQSSDEARSAFRTLIRAALLEAAHGDAAQLLAGRVQQGATLRPGATLRVSLNRVAPLGTRLQLFDGANQLAGLVQVEDHDDTGAVVSVVAGYVAAAQVTAAFTVSGRASR